MNTPIAHIIVAVNLRRNSAYPFEEKRTMRRCSLTLAEATILVGIMVVGGCSASLGEKNVARAMSTMTSPNDPPSGDLVMQASLVANRHGDELTPGECGWCILSLCNTSQQPLTVRTVAFAGKGNSQRIPSGGKFPGYSGIGIATLSVLWSKEHVMGEWQELPPPDDPIILGPNEARTIARIVQAHKDPGVYTFRVRLDTANVIRALHTRNNALPAEHICVEARLTGVSVVAVR